jgi:hypothetical protein
MYLLSTDSNDTFAFQGYNIHRNDQNTNSQTRPPHGLIIFSRNSTVEVQNQQIYSSPEFEYTYQMILYKNIPIQIIVMYIAPNCLMPTFKTNILKLKGLFNFHFPFILIGDMNIDAGSSSNNAKISFIEQSLQCKQHVSQVTTNHKSILDHIYTNAQLGETGTIDTSWSDHKFIYASLLLER